MSDLLYKDEVYGIIGAAMEVHKELGPGFLEAVYQEALTIQFEEQKIPCVVQPQLGIYFKETKLEKYYMPDFLCFDKIVVEIKALQKISPIEEAQILNSTRVAKFKLGVLINFGAISLQWKRYII
jgi:GxxExxY protein